MKRIDHMFIKLCHTQPPDNYGRVFTIVQLYKNGQLVKRQPILLGAPRLKLRYHVLQNASKESPVNVYATIYHSDWQAVQERFCFLGKEHRTEKGWIKTPAIVVGHKRR